ncbi:thioredoxin domain-containing protein [Microbacterium sp.]|uniref:DsbA family protein n=1 Tax=Microbacterium sp. TaxID=51671 RepID=UPI00322212C3
MAGSTKTNWFAIWVSVAIVVVVAVVIGVVVWMNNAATDPGTRPEASNVNVETGAITVGEGTGTIATYVDFMCPICNQFEQLYGDAIDEALADGSASLDIHPIAILDSRSQGTAFSTRAANAMYCVAVEDEDKSLPFLRAMFENQPAEGTAGLTDAQILDIAKGVGVSGIDSCVTDGTYSKFVTAMTQKTPANPETGRVGTPTVLVDDEIISLTGDPATDITARLK